MLKMTLVNNVDLAKMIEPKVKQATRIIVNELEKIARPYTPYLEGGLIDSLNVYEGQGAYIFSYNVDYAKSLYYGDEKWNWTKDFNILAGPRWVHRAWEIHGGDILRKAGSL